MKKLEFEPSDLKGCYGCQAQAQVKFDKWYKENIENAPIVYQSKQHEAWTDAKEANGIERILSALFKKRARLVCIEEIEKKECGHEYVLLNEYGCGFVCRDCRKLLKPKGGWEVFK